MSQPSEGGAMGAVAVLLGPALKQAGAELKRLGTQGSMELASAIFNGHAFVPYGPGQYPPSPERGVGPGQEVSEQQHAPQQGRGGRGR